MGSFITGFKFKAVFGNFKKSHFFLKHFRYLRQILQSLQEKNKMQEALKVAFVLAQHWGVKKTIKGGRWTDESEESESARSPNGGKSKDKRKREPE